MKFQVTHLDAMQGGQEERESRIGNTVSERQTPADPPQADQEPRQVLRLSRKAGRGGE